MPVETIMNAESEPPAVAGGLPEESERKILTDAGFYLREAKGVKVLVCEPLEKAGFVNGFSTRLGGNIFECAVLAAYAVSDRKVYVADSFEELYMRASHRAGRRFETHDPIRLAIVYIFQRSRSKVGYLRSDKSRRQLLQEFAAQWVL